ncbi:zinc-dependent metalloprotease [Mangrovivirga sp. M17]|uniref:Zinc-dependent metalloprotease n=1 Tax=Mangrovivirga halotolerans TaxID=2993936 RepID=A0ABT3RSP3_9BACT|nr:zinc-dependent metalloprotease [Mangrovivirga halotolerans]MCX2744645.1 zinc-dependent metalloprotease [Mangrovivirga halotolerans]
MNHIKLFRLFVSLFILSACASANQAASDETEEDKVKVVEGFFDYKIDAASQKVYLKVKHYDSLFLYINSLTAGIGSNDIGLDRGQLGNSRMVKFSKYGNKVLLIEPNSSYVAVTDNSFEVRAVEEAFAKSVLASFSIEKKKSGSTDGDWIDITDFITRDAHNIAKTLKDQGQGSYTLDKEASVILPEKSFNFPRNTEFEAMLTFRGEPQDYEIRSVTPTAGAVTIQVRNSFVSLPEEGFEPVKFHPGGGYFGIRRYNYASPIDQPIEERFITKHRLIKKDTEAEISEPVEPIVYYLDPGTPEPVRSALLDGASWWDQAFEAAGFKNAFQVKVLPDSIHPMDSRYNVIQWVHRSTRGWSYGVQVIDPRTGEIVKGMVTLGSLRVRQDFLIAQALVPAYGLNPNTAPHMALALARIRQLSAHEVGHTLGLAHNYAASSYGRESVMDYPHPYVYEGADGQLKFDSAYDAGIGEWDKVAINYGYGDHSEEERKKVISEASEKGIYFLSDQDARPIYGAHPETHLWDNGLSADQELKRVLKIRKIALDKFGPDNLPEGRSYSDLEEMLAPLYFFHRYQLEAAVKLIGGVDYRYSVKGEGNLINEPVSAEVQSEALSTILETISLENLMLSDKILSVIPPKSYGDRKGRESLMGKTDPVLDPVGIAETASSFTFNALLNPQRINRLSIQSSQEDNLITVKDVFDSILNEIKKGTGKSEFGNQIMFSVRNQFIKRIIELKEDKNSSVSVKAEILVFLEKLNDSLVNSDQPEDKLLSNYISEYLEGELKSVPASPPKIPDGSPIGSGIKCY